MSAQMSSPEPETALPVAKSPELAQGGPAIEAALVHEQAIATPEPPSVADAPAALAHAALARHYEALASWNKILLLEQRVPFGEVPIIGTIFRAMLRLVLLGKLTWEQASLNGVMLEESRIFSDYIDKGEDKAQLESTATRVAELETLGWATQERLNHVEAWQTQLHRAEILALESIYRRIGTPAGFTVHKGPFAGMRYLSQLAGDALWNGSAKVPKLVGAYESELHDVVREMVEADYDVIVNIGCGEGYYAVGFAITLPHAHVYAFDIEEQNQKWCEEAAGLNNVKDRITIAGECTVDDLRMLITKPALLFVDCEGCELDLLRLDVLPQLTQCDVLVELHDFIHPVISTTIQERFASTHTITILDAVRRDCDDYPVLQDFTAIEQMLAVEEFRPEGMQWAWLKAKSVHSTALVGQQE